LEEYAKGDVVRKVSELGQSREAVVLSAAPISFEASEYQEVIEFACELSYEEGGATKSYRFTLRTARDRPSAPYLRGWQVTTLVAAEPQ
jgi:hypothetical protein